MNPWPLPFTRVHLTGRELEYLREALAGREFGGDGSFARRCERWLEQETGCARALLTPSGTAALEMAALLAAVGPGDEVVMPSFTFSSTANAFVLRGATPVFVDVEPRTLTIDLARVEAALTARTRAIVPVHYGGEPCDMVALHRLAQRHELLLIEDAAQAMIARLDGRALGTFGALGALSFHQTKNITAGEAGALLVNDPSLVARAEVLREKGTDRSRFHRGEVDKYRWVDVGSSYLPSELVAAFLLAQLEQAAAITAQRCALWEHYHTALELLERDGRLERPTRPPGGPTNAHLYAVRMPDVTRRDATMAFLRTRGIVAVSHYVPLHSAPAGLRYGRSVGPMTVTDDVSDRLLRLPLWPDMRDDDVDTIVAALAAVPM